MNQLTVSSLNRVMNCRPSAPGVLPSAREEASEAAENGTAVHAYLDACIKIGRDAALESCSERWPDMQSTFEAIDLSQIPAGKPGEFSSEVPFAIHLISGEVELIEPHDYRHEYKAPDGNGHWLFGTADVVGVGDDFVLVYDYKTGRGPLGMASNNWQLKALAYAAATVYGKNKAIVALIRIIPDRPPVYYSAEFDAFDLAKIRTDLALLDADLSDAGKADPPGYSPGDHCRYCPALRFCPANLASIHTITRHLPEEITTEMTPVEAGEAWWRIKLVEEYLERAKITLKLIADSTPLILPNGIKLAAIEQTRETIDPDITLAVLQRSSYPQIASAAIETVKKTSKDAIRKALREESGLKGKPLTAAYELLLSEIRTRGGASESVFFKMSEIETESK